MKSGFPFHANIAEMVRADIATFIDTNIQTDPDVSVFAFQNNRSERVLEKLAIGYSVFELSEGYRSDGTESWITESINYVFAPTLSEDEKNELDCAIPINQVLYPEVGSRLYDHFFVVDLPLVNKEDPLDSKRHKLFSLIGQMFKTMYAGILQ